MNDRRALFSHLDGALGCAASALAACRAFDHQLQHDQTARCTEAAPCRLCYYDAAAAVAAVLLFFEESRLIDAEGAWV